MTAARTEPSDRESKNKHFASVLNQIDNGMDDEDAKKMVQFEEKHSIAGEVSDGAYADEEYDRNDVDDNDAIEEDHLESPVTKMKSPLLSTLAKPSFHQFKDHNLASLSDTMKDVKISRLDSDKGENNDISIKCNVKYTSFIVSWIDAEDYNPRVSIIIHLPSGISRKNIIFKVEDDGMHINYYEKYNSVFKDPAFLLEAYPEAKLTDMMCVTMGNLLREERQVIADGYCDDIKAHWQIPLPFPCEVNPLKVRVGPRGELSDMKLVRFLTKKKELVYLVAYVELEGRKKHKTRQIGVSA